MKSIIIIGICFLLLINSLMYVESGCTSNCDDDCNNSDCSTGCRTNCQTPCRRNCNKNLDCRSKCDVKEVVEPEVQKMKETIIVPPRDSGSKTSNTNDIRNDYNVDINPNITMTNRITNVNNISVPINVTSVNINNIRVSSLDSRSMQTNITAKAGEDCSGRNAPPSCNRNQKQIVILPYPQFRAPQIVTPPSQPKVFIQPIVRQPIIVQSPQISTPPPQRVPIMIPTPVIQPNSFPLQPQPVVQPMPQYYWFSQQYIRQPQQTVMAQPQQQMIYPTQSQPCGTQGGQCGQYCTNQPCSQAQQIIPVNYPVPTTSCQSGDCASRMMYALTSPVVSSNQVSQYTGINPFLLRNGLSQYGAMSNFDSRNGLTQIGTSDPYNSRNGLPQFANVRGGYMGQMPIGLDSYFIQDQNDQFSRYQMQGRNFTNPSKIPSV